jgi:hypothetical protein
MRECTYYVVATGPEARLREVITFLRSAIRDERGPNHSDRYVLYVDRLFPDVESGENRAITVFSAGDAGGWFQLEPDPIEFTREEVADFTLMREGIEKLGLEHCLDLAGSDRRFLKWLACERGNTAYRREEATLRISGISKVGTPVGLVKPLSEMYPDVDFEAGRATEHDIYEHFVFKDGVACLIHSVSPEFTYYTKIYVADGIVLDPPEFLVFDDWKDEAVEIADLL